MTGTNKRRVTLFLDPALLKQTKAQAVAEETSVSAMIEKILVKYLPKETVIRKPSVRRKP